MWTPLAALLTASLAAASPLGRNFTRPDYVIIGGGASGFVLAEQLSRDPRVSVTLLEAGPENAGVDLIDVPGYAPNLLDTPHTWNYSSQPDPNIEDVTVPLHQGRGFGGGTAVNYMGACRGAPSVFDEWAETSGDEGLRWENIDHDFRATAHYTEVELGYDPHITEAAYGDGPVELTAPRSNLGFVQQLRSAWTNVLGLSNADFNDGTGLGIASGTTSVRASNGTRSFASQAFGWQLAGRPNAQQLYHAEVTRIGFQGRRAVSVTYIDPTNPSRHTTLHPREVILAAGALNSPKLLMLSGVGPADHLEELGIPVVADIPEIGQNLQDHHIAFMSFEVNSIPETLWQYTQNRTFAAIAEEEYAAHGTGVLATPNGAAFAMYRVPDEVFEAVDDTFHPSLPEDRAHLLFQYSSSQLSSGMPNVSIVSPFVSLVQPEDPGHLELASADYRDAPLIYSNYWGSAGDRAAIMHGYRMLQNITQDPEFAQFIVRPLHPAQPPTNDEELWSAISHGASSFHHPLGTVALGSVVEGGSWRVRGLQGLRVVDSSTIPSPPTCHPMAIIYAYAHHAAGLIRAQDRF
ncbi:GMC oxidoreductase-domain-containing protein [Aspergillus aurantiobrunneus]